MNHFLADISLTEQPVLFFTENQKYKKGSSAPFLILLLFSKQARQ